MSEKQQSVEINTGNDLKYWDTQAQTQLFSSGYKDNIVQLLEWTVLEKSLNDCLLKLDSDKANLSFLEIGCHVGFTTQKIHQQAKPKKYDAVDLSQAAIDAANEYKNIHGFADVAFLCASAASIPIQRGNYDICFAIRCIQNIQNIQHQIDAFNEIARLTKAGGYFILVENWLNTNKQLNEIRTISGLVRIDEPRHCKFLDDDILRPHLSTHFEIVDEIHFASAYYFGTRYAKWLSSAAPVADLNDAHNKFYSEIAQDSFRLKLGPSLMVLKKRGVESDNFF